MKSSNKILKYQTKGCFDFIDITKEIQTFVQQSKISEGLVNIQILHTSAALLLNENEPLLLEDFKENLEKTASQNQNYHHDDIQHRTVNVCPDECLNGHAHCKAIHLLANITLNLTQNKIQLGQWQSIMLVELDSARPRQVHVQIVGE